MLARDLLSNAWGGAARRWTVSAPQGRPAASAVEPYFASA